MVFNGDDDDGGGNGSGGMNMFIKNRFIRIRHFDRGKMLGIFHVKLRIMFASGNIITLLL